MRLAVVDEGKVLVYIPDPSQAIASHGFEPAWLPVFYNPKMEFNRDLSVLALQAYLDNYAPRKPIVVVEPLAATGVRALRYALEVDGVMKVYASDIDKLAFEIMELNVGLNNAWGRVDVVNSDANALMYTLKAHGVPVLAIDIDPYGSPAPFLEAALNLVGNGGLLIVTATDTAVLEGSRKLKAFRRYGLRLEKTPCSREVAVRALLSYIARVAASLDKWIKPLLSLYIDYYVRLFIQVRRGAREAQRMLEENLGYAYYYPKLGYLTIRSEVYSKLGSVENLPLGPLWIREIFDLGFVEMMMARLRGRYEYLRTRRRAEKLLEIIREEALVQEDVYQRVDAIASTLKTPTPSKVKIVEDLRTRGLKASLTHFHPVGVRTDASVEELREIIKSYSS